MRLSYSRLCNWHCTFHCLITIMKIGNKNKSIDIYDITEVIRMKSIKELKENSPFPIGEENKGFAQYFSGKSYLSFLSTEQVGIAHVTFEPGCRNNWHIHHGAGQILICTAGTGYYQEWGKELRELQPGDVVNSLQKLNIGMGQSQTVGFLTLRLKFQVDLVVNG